MSVRDLDPEKRAGLHFTWVIVVDALLDGGVRNILVRIFVGDK